MGKKILVVEDEKNILKLVVENLIAEGYEVITATNGEEAVNTFAGSKPDLIILDLKLPKKSGYEVCAEVRKRDPAVPIIMLTARKRESDKLTGFKQGADDYLTKPFSIAELLARIEALFRRASLPGKRGELTQYSFGDVTIDFVRMETVKKGKKLKFTKRQYDILRYLIQREGEAVSREELLENVWKYDTDITSRTIDNFIYDIRKKIENDPSDPRHILGVHSVGYKFSA